MTSSASASAPPNWRASYAGRNDSVKNWRGSRRGSAARTQGSPEDGHVTVIAGISPGLARLGMELADAPSEATMGLEKGLMRSCQLTKGGHVAGLNAMSSRVRQGLLL